MNSVTGSTKIFSELRSIFENFPQPVLALNDKFELTYFNEAFEKLTGYIKSELLSKKIFSLFPESYISEKNHSYFALKNEEKILTLKKQDGNLITVKTQMFNLNAFPSLKFIILKETNTSEFTYKELLENSLVGIYLVQDGVFKLVNKKFLEIGGYREEEVINKPFWLFIHPQDREIVKKRGLQREKGDNVPSQYQFKALRKNGESIDVEIRAVRVKYNGKPAILGNVRDITNLKRKEEELRKLKEFNEMIIRNMQEGVILRDLHDKIVFVNPKIAEITGFKEEELVGSEWNKLFTFSEYEEEGSRRDKERTSRRYEAYLKTKKGEMIPVMINSNSLTKEGGFQGFLSVIVDTREIKEMEKELKEVIRDLKNFDFIISQDLKGPIRAIRNYALFLKKEIKKLKEIPPEVSLYTERIIKNTKILNKMIEDLLYYSILSKSQMRFKEVNLDQVIKDILFNLKETIRENNAQVIINNPLPKVKGAKSQLYKLFEILILDGITFNYSSNPLVKISYVRDNEGFIFKIEDNGTFLTEYQLRNLFKSARGLRLAKEEHLSLSTNLAICKRIVERHEGKLWVETRRNKGTTVYLTFPHP